MLALVMCCAVPWACGWAKDVACMVLELWRDSMRYMSLKWWFVVVCCAVVLDS